MTQPPLPPRFAEVSEALRSAMGDPEAIAVQAERMQALHQELLSITAEPQEGHSESSRCTVTLDAGGALHAVAFDGSLTLRPTPTTITQEFQEAYESARATAFENMRTKYKEQFDIELPEFDARTAEATQEAEAGIAASLAPALQDSLLGPKLAGIVERTRAFAQREFVGTDGCVTLTMRPDKQPTTVEIDPMLLRDIDNITLGEQFLRAWQNAAAAIDEAQAELSAVEWGDLDPQVIRARAEESLDVARRKIAEAGF
ncbi:hypothetical protein [Aestuariimicrobium sp. Y1814]|uniref:hypothetical protein n=1 Tax=Aestuariimicrobium sp. Y1814 TaxID=3418742 RepID=UPI003DA6FDB1